MTRAYSPSFRGADRGTSSAQRSSDTVDVGRAASIALRLARLGMTRLAIRRLPLRQLGQDRFVQANAGIHVLEREILVRRMRAAIRQRQTEQKRLDSENACEIARRSGCCRPRG